MNKKIKAMFKASPLFFISLDRVFYTVVYVTVTTD
jgi:hypothetical protein